MATAPRRVDPFSEPTDFQCALMAEFGMSTKAIVEHTQLTPAQVDYRTRNKFHIKRSSYRNGASLGARTVLRFGRQWVGYELEQRLRSEIGVR